MNSTEFARAHPKTNRYNGSHSIRNGSSFSPRIYEVFTIRSNEQKKIENSQKFSWFGRLKFFFHEFSLFLQTKTAHRNNHIFYIYISIENTTKILPTKTI